MGRDQNTVAKRLREMDRKRKAQDKRVRRQMRKDQPVASEPLQPDSAESESASPSTTTDSNASAGPARL